MAHPAGLFRPGVPVQHGRQLSPLHRELQAAHGGRPAGPRASAPEPPRPRSPLGRKPGGHGGHSIKAVQAQLGHRSWQSTHMYAHLGSGAQRRLVESLRPAAPPHVPSGQRAKRKARSVSAKCLTSLVAGARHAQRCPAQFRLPMEAVIAPKPMESDSTAPHRAHVPNSGLTDARGTRCSAARSANPEGRR